MLKKNAVILGLGVLVLVGCSNVETKSADEELIQLIDDSIAQKQRSIQDAHQTFNAWEEEGIEYAQIEFLQEDPILYDWSVMKDGNLLLGCGSVENDQIVIDRESISTLTDQGNQKAIYMYSLFGKAFRENEEHRMELDPQYKVTKDNETYTIAYETNQSKDDGTPKEIELVVKSAKGKVSQVDGMYVFEDGQSKSSSSAITYKAQVTNEEKEAIEALMAE